MKKVTILLTKEIMEANPVFKEHGFSAGRKVTISSGKEGESDTAKGLSTDPEKPRPPKP